MGLLDAQIPGFHADAFLHIAEHLQGQIQEIPRATRRVQDAELAQAQEKPGIGIPRGFTGLAALALPLVPPG